jgi:hypothetical protein
VLVAGVQFIQGGFGAISKAENDRVFPWNQETEPDDGVYETIRKVITGIVDKSRNLGGVPGCLSG